jgi:site-specific DNA-methyltransferase (adenine-specific)
MNRSTINLHLGDSLEAMKLIKDNAYDLAIVDPPYGIGEDGAKNHSRGKRAKPNMYKDKDWDRKTEDKRYFIELKRVSKNQIIWGANHFIENIPEANSSGWAVWDKMEKENDMSTCELAYTSFSKGVRKFKFLWSGYWQGDMKNKETRIHPTQKPVKLYEWLLTNYAKEGDKILDTHLGSMSIALACHNLKFDLDGWELDEDYHAAGVKRFEQHKKQLQLF